MLLIYKKTAPCMLSVEVNAGGINIKINSDYIKINSSSFHIRTLHIIRFRQVVYAVLDDS